MYDLVIRGGTVVDGPGAPARAADMAVTGGTVTEVGRVDGGAGVQTIEHSRRTGELPGCLVRGARPS